MLRAIHSLTGYKIKAADGEIGKVDQFLFDERQWTLRYLVVQTGHWLTKRKVLLSPLSITRADWLTQHLHVSLTREQVADSPDLDADLPLSREREIEILDYYQWPYYWLGEGFWGPRSPHLAPAAGEPEGAGRPGPGDCLHATRDLTGYHIQARDRAFGHVEDFIVNEENWSIRYLAVATHNFWPGGRSVLLAPQWINKIDLSGRRVHVELDSATIQEGPVFDPYAPVNRAYEVRLYDYHGRPKYWETELEHEHAEARPSQRGSALPSVLNPKV